MPIVLVPIYRTDFVLANLVWELWQAEEAMGNLLEHNLELSKKVRDLKEELRRAYGD